MSAPGTSHYQPNTSEPNAGVIAPVSAERSRKLSNLILWAAGVGGATLVYTSPHEELSHTMAGLAIYILAVLPIAMWARKSRPWFPVFEIFMATCIPFYAIPYLGGRSEIEVFTESTLINTAMVLIAFQVSALVTFVSTRGRESTNRNLIQEIVPKSITSHSTWGLWANTVYIFLNGFTDIIPGEFRSIFRAVFFGIGIVSVFICGRKWGRRELKRSEKVIVTINLFLQSVLQAASLYLISVIALLALAAISYATASRKVPWVAFIVLSVIALLHHGKSSMRSVYWDFETRKTPELSELPAFYNEWIGYGLDPLEDSKEDQAISTGLLHRASLFQMLALTVDEVPRKRDFLGGDSYVDIPALFVPRIFWPGKPTALESNDRLSVHFGLVREGSEGNVSIAFGTVAEAYANFGTFGAVLLGFMMGYGFKRVCIAAVHAPPFSALGLFSILLTAWSFQVEMVAATWISSLFQATVVVVLGPLFAKRFLG